MSITIRPAKKTDAAAICTIYNYYVRDTLSTFQEAPVKEETFQQAIDNADNNRPFLCAIADEQVVGYCYADYLRSRCGYRYLYENSIYVSPTYINKGIGKILMSALLARLRNDGNARKIIAVIGLPNPSSVAFHERFGFVHCGTLPAVGWKFNRWIDSGYWLLDLNKPDPPADSADSRSG